MRITVCGWYSFIINIDLKELSEPDIENLYATTQKWNDKNKGKVVS